MTTARQWLDDLTSHFTPSSSQFDGARNHRAAIEARLDTYLGVNEMFEIGSLRHGTGVWLYSDADYLVSLKGIRPAPVDDAEQGQGTAASTVPKHHRCGSPGAVEDSRWS